MVRAGEGGVVEVILGKTLNECLHLLTEKVDALQCRGTVSDLQNVCVFVCVCVCVHVSGVCDDREAEGNIKQSIRTVYMKVQTVAFKP